MQHKTQLGLTPQNLELQPLKPSPPVCPGVDGAVNGGEDCPPPVDGRRGGELKAQLGPSHGPAGEHQGKGVERIHSVEMAHTAIILSATSNFRTPRSPPLTWWRWIPLRWAIEALRHPPGVVSGRMPLHPAARWPGPLTIACPRQHTRPIAMAS